MKIDNFKEIEFAYENIEGHVVDSSEIIDFDISPFEYFINGDKVYLARIKMNSNITNFRHLPENVSMFWLNVDGDDYYLNPARRINFCNDIIEIVIYKNGGYIQRLVPYWGNFNIDERNLYQKSFYETKLVNGEIKLTGKFIIEIYIKEANESLLNEFDSCNVYNNVINEMLVDNNPLCFKGDNKLLKNTYYREAWVLSQKYIDNKVKNEDDAYNILYKEIHGYWREYSERYKTQLKDISKEIYKRINNIKNCGDMVITNTKDDPIAQVLQKAVDKVISERKDKHK